MSLKESEVGTTSQGFSFWTGYFFVINVSVGAGFLNIPAVFQKTGWAFSAGFILVTALLSYVMGSQLIEVMSRVQVISQLQERGMQIQKPTFKQVFWRAKDGELIDHDDELIDHEESTPFISDKRYDMTELVRILFGNKLSYTYLFLMAGYMQGAQVAYVSVFASSFASNVPIGNLSTCDIYSTDSFYNDCRWKYWIYLSIYACLMMYLTLKGIKEQKWVQTFLTFMRFGIILTICITCLAALLADKRIDKDASNDGDIGPVYDWRYTGHAVFTVTFAFVYHLNFPSIIEFVKDRQKSLPKIIMLASTTCFLLYVFVGLSAASAIGSVESEVTLSYRDYSGGFSTRPWWSYGISFIIVLFPAIDVFSCFPLMAISISDNLTTMCYGVGYKGKGLTMFRVVVVCLPVAIAFFEYNLGVISTVVGVFGFILGPLGIPMLHLASREMLKTKGPYDTKLAPKSLVLGYLVFYILLIIFSLVLLGIYS